MRSRKTNGGPKHSAPADREKPSIRPPGTILVSQHRRRDRSKGVLSVKPYWRRGTPAPAKNPLELLLRALKDLEQFRRDGTVVDRQLREATAAMAEWDSASHRKWTPALGGYPTEASPPKPEDRLYAMFMTMSLEKLARAVDDEVLADAGLLRLKDRGLAD